MNIYVLQGEEQLGPYTVGEINDRLARGQLTASTLAWYEGSPEWVPLGTIPEVDGTVPRAPRFSSEGERANSNDSTNGGSASSSASQRPQGAVTVKSGGVAPRLPLDHQSGRGGRHILVLFVVLCVGAVVWAFTVGPASLNASRGKPDESSEHSDTTRSQAANSGDERSSATPASAPVATSNQTSPTADAADTTTEEGYIDPVVEAYLKLSPDEQAKADRQMSRAESEKVWLYYFKGRDANGHPIPYTVEERKANALAASTACKLAQQQLDRMFFRKNDSFFTTIHSDGANRSAWYLHEYKDATFRVSQDRLTEVERMNGWQWRGTVFYESKFTRTFTGTDKAPGEKAVSNASDWSSGASFLSVALHCRAGKWTITRIDSAQGCTKPTDAELRALDRPPMRDAKVHSVDDSDNLGSPVGRYRKVVSDAIKARWYFMVDEQMSQISAGAGKIHFVVGPAGRVTDAKVVSGDANSPLVKLSFTAVREAELPAMPADLKSALGDKPFEMDYDFQMK